MRTLVFLTESSAAVIQGQAGVYNEIVQAAIAAIQGSAGNITALLNAASGTILRATLTAAGDINTAAAILIQSEINMLAQDIQTINTILQNINATVTIVSTYSRGLNPARTRAIPCKDVPLDVIS